MMRLSEQDHTTDRIIQSMILDRLSILCWQNTKDGKKGRNRPKMLGETMLKQKTETDLTSFESASSFDEYRKKLVRNKK